MYGKAIDSENPVGTLDMEKLQNEMQDDGMKLRFSSWDFSVRLLFLKLYLPVIFTV